MTLDLAAVRARYSAALGMEAVGVGVAALADSAADVAALLGEIDAMAARWQRARTLHSERTVYFTGGGSAARCHGCEDDWPCRTRRLLDTVTRDP